MPAAGFRLRHGLLLLVVANLAAGPVELDARALGLEPGRYEDLIDVPAPDSAPEVIVLGGTSLRVLRPLPR